MTKALTTTESKELAECEAVIDKGLNSFFDVGEALFTIRDKKLYRKDHADFQAYCDGKWGFTPQQNKYLIGEAYEEQKKAEGAPSGNKNAKNKGKKQLAQNGPVVSTAEVVAKKAGVSKNTVKRAAEYKKAIDRISTVNSKASSDILGGQLKISKQDVIEMAKLSEDADIGEALGNVRAGRDWHDWKNEVEEPPEVIVVSDSVGSDVPENLADVFQNAPKFKSIIKRLGDIKGEIKKLSDTDAGSLIQFNTLKTDMDNARRNIRFATPYCVCPYCKAKKSNCDACKGLGWGGETLWKNAPEEMK